jgi:aspartate aminotransferase
MLSKRAQNIQPSPTLAIDSKAKALKAQGVDVISFGAGEPDFDTPENIKDAARNAINTGYTKYCPVGGSPDLKQAIIAKFKKDNNLEYKPEEIIVSCGAKHSLYNLFQTILDKGDELLVPAPYWVSYPDMAGLAEAKTRIIKTKESDNFRLSAEQLRDEISSKTKAIVINSPSNPTGAAYTAEELRSIAEVCVERIYL